MSRVAFLLPKDPTTAHGGDVMMSKLVTSLAASAHDVVRICLSPDFATLPPEPGLVRVPKEPARSWRTVAKAVRHRQSLVHARFNSDAAVAAIDEVEADIYVAEHNYMAEAFLRSSRAAGPARLFVNTINSESLIWAHLHGRIGRLERPRIRRDEMRTALAAYAVSTFDADEAQWYRDGGAKRVTWLGITLPPADRFDVIDSGPRLVFLGDRTWPPNAEAADLIRSWWPEIAAGIPGAELIVVGQSARGERMYARPGITELGFVEDLPSLLSTCRGLAAPIRTGGGVRVKILEAASHGLPVVSTTVGVGSLRKLFGITPYDDRTAFITRCRELLSDAALAAAEGARLHRANSDHWGSGRPQRMVNDWLAS
jgi:glycosyltransferase involved in cell wall biosynthesis